MTYVNYNGQTLEHIRTKEKRSASHRNDKKLFFIGSDEAFNAEEWHASYPEAQKAK